MIKMCVIFTKDVSYGKRLLNSMTEKVKREISWRFFGRLKDLQAYADESVCDVEVLITDEGSYCEELLDIESGKFIVLTEKQYSVKEVRNLYGEYAVGICRYQPVEELYRQIVDACGLRKRRTVGGTELIGIYSPTIGIPKQIFSLCVAKAMSERYRVLYINFDAFTGLSEILKERDGESVSDALYYYRQSGLTALSKIKETVSTFNGLDYIAPVRSVEDISCVSIDELKGFISCFLEDNDYEFIVINIYGICDDVCALLDMCTKVYMPVRDDYLSLQSVKEFEQYYFETDREELIGSIDKVKLPEGEADVGADFLEKAQYKGMYRYVKNLLKQE